MIALPTVTPMANTYLYAHKLKNSKEVLFRYIISIRKTPFYTINCQQVQFFCKPLYFACLQWLGQWSKKSTSVYLGNKFALYLLLTSYKGLLFISVAFLKPQTESLISRKGKPRPFGSPVKGCSFCYYQGSGMRQV